MFVLLTSFNYNVMIYIDLPKFGCLMFLKVFVRLNLEHPQIQPTPSVKATTRPIRAFSANPDQFQPSALDPDAPVRDPECRHMFESFEHIAAI